MSQKLLADRAGLSQAFISQIESGNKSIEWRSTMTAIAAALQVSVAELTGQVEPGDPGRDQTTVHIPAIREALVMREAGVRTDEPVAPEVVRRVMLAEIRCDYPAAMSPLPGLLRSATGPGLVDLARFTMFLLKSHGQPDLARDAARLSLAEARSMGDPAWLGAAAFAWANSLPDETATLAARGTPTTVSRSPGSGRSTSASAPPSGWCWRWSRTGRMRCVVIRRRACRLAPHLTMVRKSAVPHVSETAIKQLATDLDNLLGGVRR
jgi:transcriptional regulator with XRE-family HTH domain